MPVTEARQDDEAIEQLVRQAQAGDAAVFDEVARACYDRIHRWALVRTGDEDDADDVTQAVLIQLHRRIGQWSGRSRFTTWLYRVTMNAAGSWQRNVAARGRLAGRIGEDTEVPEAGGGDPAQAAERAIVMDLVRSFFEALPGKQRQVFDLADLQGFGQSEIAEMLGINPATVRAHLFRARRAIRARILALDPTLREEIS
ncbi:MAG TPA: RNA polymerase sigma factor [Gemmatimonadales bacterium]